MLHLNVSSNSKIRYSYKKDFGLNVSKARLDLHQICLSKFMCIKVVFKIAWLSVSFTLLNSGCFSIFFILRKPLRWSKQLGMWCLIYSRHIHPWPLFCRSKWEAKNYIKDKRERAKQISHCSRKIVPTGACLEGACQCLMVVVWLSGLAPSLSVSLPFLFSHLPLHSLTVYHRHIYSYFQCAAHSHVHIYYLCPILCPLSHKV